VRFGAVVDALDFGRLDAKQLVGREAKRPGQVDYCRRRWATFTRLPNRNGARLCGRSWHRQTGSLGLFRHSMAIRQLQEINRATHPAKLERDEHELIEKTGTEEAEDVWSKIWMCCVWPK
jgi:hypothetical protein